MDGVEEKISRPGLSFHLRISEYSDCSSSHSLLPEVPWAPGPAALPRAWALGWLLLPWSQMERRGEGAGGVGVGAPTALSKEN